MSVKILKEFSNGGNSSSQSTSISSNKKTPTEILKAGRFEVQEGSDDSKGLAIASNGMVAVEYDIAEGRFAVRPDNDLGLDSQTLPKFKQDVVSCEKMANQLSKLGE